MGLCRASLAEPQAERAKESATRAEPRLCEARTTGTLRLCPAPCPTHGSFTALPFPLGKGLGVRSPTLRGAHNWDSETLPRPLSNSWFFHRTPLPFREGVGG